MVRYALNTVAVDVLHSWIEKIEWKLRICGFLLAQYRMWLITIAGPESGFDLIPPTS
jgi:hypothetical protein